MGQWMLPWQKAVDDELVGWSGLGNFGCEQGIEHIDMEIRE